MKKSLKVNAVLNIIRNLMSVLFPLITYPYVTRVLGVENLGKVTYAQSIVSYFALIAALGVTTYAVREGSKYRDDKTAIVHFVNEVFTTNLMTTLVSYGLLSFCLLFVNKFQTYRELILLLSASMLFTTIGVDWINVIYEDYFTITVRSVIIQFLNLVLLFAFVKTSSDYYVYAFLMVFSNIVVCIWNFIYCRRYIRVKIVRRCCFFEHIKSMLVFFTNSFAVTIYCSVGSTMLGWMLGDVSVGIYSVAAKAYTVVKSLLAAAYTVCIPRLANYYARGDIAGYRKLVDDLFSIMFLILFPAMVGITVLAEPIIMFLGGAGYEAAIPTLQILSVALVFAIIGGVFSNCINIPTGKEKLSLTATIVAAVLNVAVNLITIPLWKHNGVAVAAVVAEISVMAVCFFGNRETKKMITGGVVAKNTKHATIGSLGIVGIVFGLKQVLNSAIVLCVVAVLLSVIFYGLMLIALRNEYAMYGVRMIRDKMFND